MRSPILSAVAALAWLALGGCGSSNERPLTAGELAARGSAICERARSEQGALSPQDAQGLKEAIPQLEEITTRELADLSKLSPPPTKQRAYDALLRTGSEVNALLEPLSSALANEGRVSPDLLAQGQELTERFAVLANALGMSVCSAPTSPTG